VKKIKKQQASPKKLTLITDIIATIIKTRIIFLEACNLLLTSPGGGKVEDLNGKTHVDGRLASLFFYSRSELYSEFSKQLFGKYMQKKAKLLANLTKATVGILAKREEDLSMTTPKIIQNGVFFFGREKFQEQTLAFILHPEKKKGFRSLELGACRDFFRDFHVVKYKDETYDPEGLQIDCLEGMGTLFKLFATKNISNIYITKELEAVRIAGQIGSSLQAEVEIKASGSKFALLNSFGDDLKFMFITSKAKLVEVQSEAEEAINVTPSSYEKCDRCWHYREDVGADTAHPHICGRCASNLFGAGESRHFA